MSQLKRIEKFFFFDNNFLKKKEINPGSLDHDKQHQSISKDWLKLFDMHDFSIIGKSWTYLKLSQVRVDQLGWECTEKPWWWWFTMIMNIDMKFNLLHDSVSRSCLCCCWGFKSKYIFVASTSFLDAIASPSTYPCQSVSQPVSWS